MGQNKSWINDQQRVAYQINVSVTMEKIYVDKDDNPVGGTGQRLSVNEDAQLPLRSFLEVCQVLSRFHELVVAIRAEKADPLSPR